MLVYEIQKAANNILPCVAGGLCTKFVETISKWKLTARNTWKYVTCYRWQQERIRLQYINYSSNNRNIWNQQKCYMQQKPWRRLQPSPGFHQCQQPWYQFKYPTRRSIRVSLQLVAETSPTTVIEAIAAITNKTQHKQEADKIIFPSKTTHTFRVVKLRSQDNRQILPRSRKCQLKKRGGTSKQ